MIERPGTRGAGWGRPEDEAIQSDAYLEWLLVSGGSAAARREDVPGELAPSPQLVRAALALRRALPRFHPSFRFEEALAARLRAAAATGAVPDAPPADDVAPGRAALLPFPAASAAAAERRAARRERRGDARLILGGALASGVSLAGAAWLVRRREQR